MTVLIHFPRESRVHRPPPQKKIWKLKSVDLSLMTQEKLKSCGLTDREVLRTYSFTYKWKIHKAFFLKSKTLESWVKKNGKSCESFTHDSFVSVTWLIRICDVTHSYLWHDSFVPVTWLIRVGPSRNIPWSIVHNPHCLTENVPCGGPFVVTLNPKP